MSVANEGTPAATKLTDGATPGALWLADDEAIRIFLLSQVASSDVVFVKDLLAYPKLTVSHVDVGV